MTLPILREFFNALGIHHDPLKMEKAKRHGIDPEYASVEHLHRQVMPCSTAQFLANGGKLPDSVVENVAKGNAFLSHLQASPKMWAKRMTDLATYKPERMKDMG